METWYYMTSMQYAYGIVEGNQCQIEELGFGRIRARKDISPGIEGSTTSLQPVPPARLERWN